MIYHRISAGLGQFPERCVREAAAAHVEHAPRHRLDLLHFQPHQTGQIVDVEHVAHLFPFAAETDVFEGAAVHVPRRPQRRHTLVCLSHLPRPGDQTAPVDHAEEAVCMQILRHHQFAAQFCGAVQRADSVQRKVLRNARMRHARSGFAGREVKPRLRLRIRQPIDGADGVDAACREEDEPGPAPAGKFEAVQQARQIGLYHVAGRAGIAGKHGRFGTALENPIHLAEVFEVCPIPHVAMDKRYVCGSQPLEIQFRTSPFQVVKREDADAAARLQLHRKRRPDKPGPARDQNRFHGMQLSPSPCRLPPGRAHVDAPHHRRISVAFLNPASGREAGSPTAESGRR